MNKELYKLNGLSEITNDGHIMFKEDVVRDLNYWRNKAMGLEEEKTDKQKIINDINTILKSEKPKILTADWLSDHRVELGDINTDLIKEFIRVIENHEKWALYEDLKQKLKEAIK